MQKSWGLKETDNKAGDKAMFFKKKTNQEMEQLITTLQMDMSNNYKDAAQDDFRRVKDCFNKNKEQMSDKMKANYEGKIAEYEKTLTGYTHKDQPVHAAPKI